MATTTDEDDETGARSETDDGGTEVATARLLWDGRRLPSRGPKPALDIDTIARTAIAIADAEGMAAVSMQRLANELDFTKMALYRYVAGKSELVAVMIDAAVGEPPDLSTVDGDSGWRARMTEFARLLAITWEEHPWLPWATVGDRAMGPREVGWTEAAVATLDGTPLDGSEKMDAVFMVFGHIRNTQSTSTAGTQAWSDDRQLDPVLSRLVPDFATRFPALTAAITSTGPTGRRSDGSANDNGRAFGLRCILDGLEALIASRSA
jgi:AcrR family transcriptional regulator